MWKVSLFYVQCERDHSLERLGSDPLSPLDKMGDLHHLLRGDEYMRERLFSLLYLRVGILISINEIRCGLAVIDAAYVASILSRVLVSQADPIFLV